MTQNMEEIRIARDFSPKPGGRYRKDGEASGQEFLEEVLRPKFEQAIRAKTSLVVNLDGVAGYGPSFLEESFGGLARAFNEKLVLDTIEFVCEDEPYLRDEIRRYVVNASKRSRKPA